MSAAIYPSLAGRRVVVTGGGSGIGAGIVKAFAAQGAEVIFIDIAVDESRALERSLSALPIPPVFCPCDLTDIDAVQKTFASIGTVDVLVNNAANDDRHTLSDITPQYWDERIAVNLRHLLFCTKAVVPGMKENGGGAIINFGSISWHLGLPDLVLYETAKAGIEGMTRALARDLGPDNIRVTCVVPGNVRTPRQTRWYTPEAEAAIVAQQCLKARLEPEHVAALVLFLASDDGRLCTGHEYWIDAGWR
jgi:NAD(P)-dependent dehydrogenase (short-subunit alcohol dehydrogenase family)